MFFLDFLYITLLLFLTKQSCYDTIPHLFFIKKIVFEWLLIRSSVQFSKHTFFAGLVNVFCNIFVNNSNISFVSVRFTKLDMSNGLTASKNITTSIAL